MKPPDEIKKGLDCCIARWAATHFASCKSDCPYWGEGVWCKNVMHSDVSTYITQLESDNAAKQKRIEELDQMVTMSSRQLSLDLGRLEYYADEKKRTDETLSYAHGEMMKLRVELHEAKSRLAQVERENKAMLHDMARYTMCGSCKHFADDGKCPQKDECVYGEIGRFEWRGVCAENTEEEADEG